MITEIYRITIGENSLEVHDLPSTIWLDNINSTEKFAFKLRLDDGFAIEIEPLSKSNYTICSAEDLENLLKKLGIKSAALLRLEIRDTKKWGRKPLFIGGINSVCFQFLIKELGDGKGRIIVLYNTSGSHEIESIYLHGVWTLL